nr:cation transporting ATPase C-terminal domain-containing protein [Corynebacterium amycolatum]
IKNAIGYLLSGNLSAIITVLFASLAGLPVPFVAVQLLFINLVTDSLPALAIGMEPGDPDILKRKPRDPKAGILDKAF